jgi:methyltransferase (TIGR00027 family)
MRRNVWPMVMRTKAIDDLLMAAIADGAERIVNLAAGFDTRPYRLPVPGTLTWIEVDLPALLDDKERLLAGETPRCRVTRERADLSDPAERTALLDRVTSGSARTVVITEGLLIYLPEAAVRDLARDLASRPAIASWIVDVVSPRVLQMIRRQVNHRFSPDAEMRFAPDHGVAYFTPLGWRPGAVRSLFRDAMRAKRLPILLRPFGLFPDPDPENPGRRPWSAVVRLDRSAGDAAPRARA